MRHALRTDNNQAEIVDALRKAGAVVEIIHEPVDLRVWADATKQKFAFFEVKNLMTTYGRKGLNPKQLADMQGHAWAMVTCPESAMGALRLLRA